MKKFATMKNVEQNPKIYQILFLMIKKLFFVNIVLKQFRTIGFVHIVKIFS